MNLSESSIAPCDSARARQDLLNAIDRLGDVVAGIEGRLQQVTLSQTGKSCGSAPAAPAPARSVLADELYNRAERISAITDRLIDLSNSLDL